MMVGASSSQGEVNMPEDEENGRLAALMAAASVWDDFDDEDEDQRSSS